jgi:hypothetical protein
MPWRGYSTHDFVDPYGYSGYRAIHHVSDSAGPSAYSDYDTIDNASDWADPYGYSAYRTTSNVTDLADPYGYSAYRTVRSERRLKFSSDARVGGDGPRFSTFNDKSQAAIRREREAKARFNKVKMVRCYHALSP